MNGPACPRPQGLQWCHIVRRLIAASTSLSALLVLAPAALGAAGGGSSGFGGGGGGGGGGGFSGGGGSSGSGSVSGGMSLVIVLLVVLFFAGTIILGVVGERRRRRRRDARVRQVRLAAAEAAEEDAAFDSEAVERDARELFTAIQAAWTARNREALNGMVSRSLMTEWGLRLDDFDRKGWHNQVTIAGEPGIHYVGLVNRESDAEDRVCVLVEATLATTSSTGTATTSSARSPAARRRRCASTGRSASATAGGWCCRSSRRRGRRTTSRAIVASPWGDDRGCDEDAVIERPSPRRCPRATTSRTLADLDFAGDARNAALDLGLADGRFAPDVLETATRRARRGVDRGGRRRGRRAARGGHAGAASELLYPRGEQAARLVVRGPSSSASRRGGSTATPSRRR